MPSTGKGTNREYQTARGAGNIGLYGQEIGERNLEGELQRPVVDGQEESQKVNPRQYMGPCVDGFIMQVEQ